MGVLLCKWLLPLWVSVVHPFYLSVTEIRHNASRKTLEVSCRIFTDDLEKSLNRQYHVSLDIMKPKDRKLVDSLLAKYIGQHLHIRTDGKAAPLHYLGYRIEEDAAWCFLESAGIPVVKQLDIDNDILYAEHESQSHMIHVIVNDRRQSTKIDNPKASASFHF